MSSPARNVLVHRQDNHAVEVQTQPKPPRSAFMCFTDAKKKEILVAADQQHKKADVLKMVAIAWRGLTDRERAYWDEQARDDKVRFVHEKAAYKGPWEQKKRRQKKHPMAPKRPMSAFLKYSQTRRTVVKVDNPDMSNTDVSRLLGEMWRNASVAERAPYVQQEQHERADYKIRIAKFRESQAKLDAASRTSHRKVKQMAEYASPMQHQYHHHQHHGPPPPPPPPHAYHVESNNMEPVRVHSVEDAATKADQRMFRPYNGPYPPQQAHHGYASKDSFDFGVLESAVPSHREYSEPEPLRRPRPPTEEERYGRSPYFQDNHSYNFYPFP